MIGPGTTGRPLGLAAANAPFLAAGPDPAALAGAAARLSDRFRALRQEPI